MDDRVLNYDIAIRFLGIIIGLIFIVAGGLLIPFALRQPNKDFVIFDFLLCSVITIFFWFIAFQIADLFFSHIIWNNQEIKSEAPWRRPKSIHWDDLQEVSYRRRIFMSPGVDRLVLRGTSGEKLIIAVKRIGSVDFANDMLRFAPSKPIAPFLQFVERNPEIASWLWGVHRERA